ncbi:hypothetical protein RRG08_042965 [Elysia crispata]|uniref:Uncharacterized protein n=1 Tax=Elysia crispata TaxID=231223 RepID=A0AAE1AZ78_9GAST|nr:hypothetical protein RRG08_042965 [Elysia crispata]
MMPRRSSQQAYHGATIRAVSDSRSPGYRYSKSAPVYTPTIKMTAFDSCLVFEVWTATPRISLNALLGLYLMGDFCLFPSPSRGFIQFAALKSLGQYFPLPARLLTFGSFTGNLEKLPSASRRSGADSAGLPSSSGVVSTEISHD